jgi:hypothetical protein
VLDGITPQESWRGLLAELGLVTAAYGAKMGAGREHYAAMFVMLSMVHSLASVYADVDEQERPGWIARLRFVPPGPDIGRAAQLTLTVLDDREP